MSQRRGAPKDAPAAEEMVPFSESLDKQNRTMAMDRESSTKEAPAAINPPTGTAKKSAPLSLDGMYETETRDLKIKQWKEGPFAASMTEPTWDAEYAKFKNDPGQECAAMSDNEGMPCICCSAIVCGMLGAGRVGNMAVLKQSTEWVEETEVDEEGETKVKRFTRPRLDFVVGPYWPMLCCVTYPLILGVSVVTLFTAIPGKHPLIVLVWAICTLGLIYALAMTAFRDPGILPRYERPPAPNDNSWRWSDRAHSFKPRGAFFDPDTGIIVEGFDHTCPWTGTAIGKKNMTAFQFFVGLVFVCLMFDIVLLTGGIR